MFRQRSDLVRVGLWSEQPESTQGGLLRRNCRREGAVRHMEVMVNSEPAVAVGMESGPGQ